MEELPDKLKQLFEEREEVFRKQTDAILEAMPHVLEGINKFLKLQKDPGDVSWHDITYGEKGEGFPAVLIIGVVSYKPGEKFTLPTGEEVVVNEKISEYFQRVIRVGIPFDIVGQGETQPVIDYLEQTLEEEKREQEDYEDMIMSLIEEPTDPPLDVAPHEEFDTDGLTEDQKKALEMFKNLNKGGSN